MTSLPTHAWCPECRQESAIDRDGACLWCDSPTVEKPKRGGWKRPDLRGSKYTEAQLRALHAAHLRGQSINALAKQTYAKAGYASHVSAASAISRQWKRMGLPARDRIEQTVLSSTKHGRKRRKQTNAEQVAYRHWLAAKRGWRAVKGPGQPRCEGTRMQHPRKGERCERSAMEGSDFCMQHDPARRGEVEQIAVMMRERQPEREVVPMAPFAEWLRELRAELGSWRAVGNAVGLSTSAVHAYGRGISPTTKEPKDEIGADVVARCREHCGSALEVA